MSRPWLLGSQSGFQGLAKAEHAGIRRAEAPLGVLPAALLSSSR